MQTTMLINSINTCDFKSTITWYAFIDQVNHNYNSFTGGFGTISKIKELELVDKNTGKLPRLAEQRQIKEHGCTNRSDIIKQILFEEYDSMDLGELRYTVDYSVNSGYEIVTYGGIKEFNICNLSNTCEKYLDINSKKYTLFRLCGPTGESVTHLYPVIRYNSLSEIENTVKKSVVAYKNVYFAIRNDGTKAFIIKPNVKIVKTTTKKSDLVNNTIDVNKIHPVYFIGNFVV